MDRGLIRLSIRAMLLLLMCAACGQSTGCSGCDSEQELLPKKDWVYNGAQLRITEGGLDFLEDNLEPVLAQALPEDGLNMCIPGDNGQISGPLGLIDYDWQFCYQNACPGDEAGCPINISIDNVDLSVVEPSIVVADITFGELSLEFSVELDWVAACSVAISGPGFSVGLPLTLDTPDPDRLLTLDLERQPEYQLSDLEFDLDGEGGLLGWLCDVGDFVINLPLLGDLILDAIQGLVDGLLGDLVGGFFDDFLCRSCADDLDCPVNEGASCNDGRCAYADGQCVPNPLGLAGILDVGSALSGVSPGLEAELKYMAVPGGYAEVENAGLSMGIVTGADAVRSRCVPPAFKPAIVTPLRTELLRSNTDPLGRDYHVGIGATQEMLNQFGWAFYNSGALCIQITNDSIEQLNATFLGLILPGLVDIARDPDAPVAITMSPQAAPELLIGANRFVENEDGQRVLDDPLLNVSIPELWLDFHVFMDERWVRILSLRMDVSLPIGIDFTPENQVIPIIGDLSEGLENLSLANGELFVDDLDLVVTLLPALLSTFAGGATAGLIEPITLPDILGYRLDMQDGSVGGIEDNSIMAIYALFAPGEEAQETVGSVETEVSILEVHAPDRDALVQAGTEAWSLPYVRLDVDAWDSRVDEGPMEYSFRLGHEGAWSAFSPLESQVIRHPKLLWQGRHQLQVRARRADDYHSLDPSPDEVEIIIDSVAPRLVLSRDDDRVSVEAFDWVSESDDIRLEYRIDGGGWILLLEPEFTIEGGELFEVRATDEVGNETVAEVRVESQGLIGRLPPGTPAESGCGCHVGQSNSPAGGWFVLGLVGLLGLRRRRRLKLIALACLTFVGLMGCEDRAPAREDIMMAMDATIPLPPDPPPPEPPCQPPTNIEDGCATVGACMAGYDMNLGEVDPDTCEAQCLCVERAHLETGPIGRYSDLVVVDDVAWVSAYAEEYGDLVVGEHRGVGGFIWYWIDGIPEDGEVVAGPTGPRGGIDAAGADVGHHTSIAAGSDGTLHIAYYDVDNRALKYALGARAENGERNWTTMTLAAEGDAGKWPSLTVGPDDIPAIAYRVGSIEGVSYLHYLSATSVAPQSPDDWSEPMVVHAIDLEGLAPDTASYPEGTGLHTSGVRDAEGLPVLAWYDRSGGRLWWSRLVDAGFSQPELLAGWGHPDPDRDGDMGANVDIALDPDGNAHFCYQDGMTDSLRYLAPALDRDEWVDDGVWIDAGDRAYAVHVVGDDCNMRIDVEGHPLIVYQDSTYHALLLRRRDVPSVDEGQTDWSGRAVLRGDDARYRGSFGFFANAEVTADRIWITHYLYDNQQDPPRAELELFIVNL